MDWAGGKNGGDRNFQAILIEQDGDSITVDVPEHVLVHWPNAAVTPDRVRDQLAALELSENDIRHVVNWARQD